MTLVGLGSGAPSLHQTGVTLVPVEERHGAAKRATLSRIYAIVSELGPDVCHCCDPWTLSVGLDIAHRRPGMRIVYDSTELYPVVYAEREDLPLLLRRVLAARVRRLEARAIREADAIIETNATRATRFVEKGKPVTLVPNYPALEDLPAVAEEREPWIAYTGLVTAHRGFDRLLEAFASIAPRFPGARLVVAGSFDPRTDIERRTRSSIREHRLEERVDLLGWLPYEQMFDAIASCSVGVILLQPGRTNDRTGQPNKLFEFMGSGLAVLASDFPEMSTVVRAADCGLVVDPTNVESISAALAGLLGDRTGTEARGKAGRQAVLENYHWDVAERNLLGLYREMLR